MLRRIVAPTALALVAFLFALRGPGASADEYTIVGGDTLSEIAERFGLSVEELAQANGIVEPDLILSGQVLVVPGAAQGRPPASEGFASGGTTYVVKLGDTLSEIAESYGVPEVAIVEANSLADAHFIVEGQRLTIPVVESPLVPPVNPEVEALLGRYAAEEGLDPSLLKALAYLESGWNQNAVSSKGAAGVMQILPSTGYWLEDEIFGFDLNIETSPNDNIRAGARYLRLLTEITDDTDQALAAYYQGYGTLSLGVIYEDTIQYVAAVKATRDRFWP